MNEEGVERRFTKGAIPSRVMRVVVVICLMRLTWEAARRRRPKNGNAGKAQLAPFLFSSIFFSFSSYGRDIRSSKASGGWISIMAGAKAHFRQTVKLQVTFFIHTRVKAIE